MHDVISSSVPWSQALSIDEAFFFSLDQVQRHQLNNHSLLRKLTVNLALGVMVAVDVPPRISGEADLLASQDTAYAVCTMS